MPDNGARRGRSSEQVGVRETLRREMDEEGWIGVCRVPRPCISRGREREGWAWRRRAPAATRLLASAVAASGQRLRGRDRWGGGERRLGVGGEKEGCVCFFFDRPD